MNQRRILRTLNSQPTTDGDGVKIRRIVGHGNLALLDPFLLLDEIASDEAADYIGGFPPHPHRGFETVTYMLEGRMRHTDHMGNEGLLQSGGVQWMTAGRGVIHAEMPEQDEGRLHGFQLWVNLPASDKMQAPRYQEFDASQIPTLTGEGYSIKVIAGSYRSQQGPVTGIATRASYFDISLDAGTRLELPTATTETVLIYLFEGEIEIHQQPLHQGQMAQLDQGDHIQLFARTPSRLLFLSGTPLQEPVVNYGPFVMNTREQIEQAMRDYRDGTLTD